MNYVLFFKFFAGLMAIMNPLVTLPIFLSLTRGDSKSEQIKIAFFSSLAVLVILVLAAYSGKAALAVFGISVGGFQIAGGILIGMIALSMMHSKTSEIPEEKHSNPAIVPLALPIMAGPGSISKTIAFSSNAHGMSDFEAIVLAIVCASAITFIILAASNFINKIMGKTGITIITRIMAIILGAIAVEMIVGGVKAEFLGIGQ
jgi:multiple antibiotic resistance protein